MSYTFAICNAALPEGEDVWDLVSHMTDEPEPNPRVFEELIDRLTARYPCICDLPRGSDEGVWCSGPLGQDRYTRATVFGLLREHIAPVLPFVIETATALGFTVYDWQTGAIHRPKLGS